MIIQIHLKCVKSSNSINMIIPIAKTFSVNTVSVRYSHNGTKNLFIFKIGWGVRNIVITYSSLFNTQYVFLVDRFV